MEIVPKRNPKRKRSRALWIVPAAVLAVAGIAYAAMMWMMSPPDDLDLALSKASADGRYVTTIEAGLDPVAVGPMHSWTIEVKTSDGAARSTMPQSASTAACPSTGTACRRNRK